MVRDRGGPAAGPQGAQGPCLRGAPSRAGHTPGTPSAAVRSRASYHRRPDLEQGAPRRAEPGLWPPSRRHRRPQELSRGLCRAAWLCTCPPRAQLRVGVWTQNERPSLFSLRFLSEEGLEPMTLPPSWVSKQRRD